MPLTIGYELESPMHQSMVEEPDFTAECQSAFSKNGFPYDFQSAARDTPTILSKESVPYYPLAPTQNSVDPTLQLQMIC